MKKVTECIKNHIWVIYLILFVFMVVRHASVKLGVADDVWFLEQSKMGLINYTQMRIQTWTSRNIIELVMLVLLNINKWAWIILDSGMFVLVKKNNLSNKRKRLDHYFFSNACNHVISFWNIWHGWMVCDDT